MTVRRAEPRDFGAVTALLEELGRAEVTPATREEAERLARKHGCWALTLESGYQRGDAHRLYEAAGMENHGYYFGKPLN